MKTTKLIAALLAMGISATAFLASCSSESEENAPAQNQEVEVPTYGITDIMNLEWTAEKEEYISSVKNVEFVGDRIGVNSTFYVAKETLSDDNDIESSENISTSRYQSTLRIYNMNTETVVKTFDNSLVNTYNSLTRETLIEYTEYAVNLISDDYFAVLKTTYSGDGTYSSTITSSYFGTMRSFFDVEYLLAVYNANGEQVKAFTHSELALRCANNINNFDKIYMGSGNANCLIYDYLAIEDSSMVVGGYFFIGNKLYKQTEEQSEPVLVKDYGLAKKPSLSYMSKHGNLFFENLRVSTNYGYSYVYALYDADLNEICKYSLPSYVSSSNYGDVAVFSDGTMLVQYATALPEEATEYDFINSSTKYDLVTVSVTKDGVTELSDVNYYISDVTCGSAEQDDQRIYADNIDVFAFIYTIGADKRLDTNISNADPVVLSSDGKVVAKVDLPANAISIPTRFSDDCFSVKLSDGSVLFYNESGAKVANLSSSASSATVIDDCFYVSSENAIYAFNGALIRDFDIDFAQVTEFGNTLLITNNAADSIVYSILLDGQIKEIGAFPIMIESVGSEEPAEIPTFDMAAGGYYWIYNPNTHMYSYYNEMCKYLGEFESELSLVKATDDFILMEYTVEVEAPSADLVDPDTSSTPSETTVTAKKLVKFVISE